MNQNSQDEEEKVDEQNKVMGEVIRFGKKVTEYPVAIRLESGELFSLSDLPDPKKQRWLARDKAKVVRAYLFGLIDFEFVETKYAIFEDEFKEWLEKYGENGERGLRIR